MTVSNQPFDHLTLYHSPTCGYCMRVYRALDTMQIKIGGANVASDYDARQLLRSQGGKTQVPALRIEHGNGKVQWMYESLDIINYLKTFKKSIAQ